MTQFIQICTKFYRGGVPGFRILWDRKSWVSKDQVATSVFATVHSWVHTLRIWNTSLTVLSVCSIKRPIKFFWVPLPEGVRNLSLGRDSTESRARRNRPNRTASDCVCVFMHVRITENRARRSSAQHEHDSTGDSYKHILCYSYQYV